MLGPTASGKTRFACRLASSLQGEIISVDSRQVYKHLDIGTGKDLHEYTIGNQSIPHHLIDVQEPEKQFYLHDFIGAAAAVFEKITQRGHLPIFCGGTGLYLDTLRNNFSFTLIPENEKLRAELRLLKKEDLLLRLQRYPSGLTSQTDLTSTKRLIRGIEIAEYKSMHPVLPELQRPDYRPYYAGITIPRDILIDKITQRLESRLQQGLVGEVENLLHRGISHQRLQELGLEYRFISFYLKGKLSYPEMKEKLRTAIIQYSKRQMTWFRKMEREGVKINWFEPDADTASVVRHINESSH